MVKVFLFSECNRGKNC